MSSPLSDAVEYSESSTTTLEWTVKNLRSLFDSSKGDIKSKVTKSVKFGGGRWQVLFYPNSGHEGGNFVSLYLSCEPTEEEKERAVNGKWVREGVFKFSFELRNINRGALSAPKEACDHAFSYKTANWGWAQFAKRDAVFYSPNTVRHVDAFLIICNITSSPTMPSPAPSSPTKVVPRSLMDAVGGLLDDPTYSDVQFILPARRLKGQTKPARTIYAAKRILQRVDYFDTMFSSGFAEAAPTSPTKSTRHARSDSISLSVAGDGEWENDDYMGSHNFDDSDESDDEDELETEPSGSPYRNPRLSMASFDPSSSATAVNSIRPDDADSAAVAHTPRANSVDDNDIQFIGGADAEEANQQQEIDEEMGDADPNQATEDGASTVHASFSEERSREKQRLSTDSSATRPNEKRVTSDEASVPGPKKTKVVVKECEYATYYAVLYYLYTDTIVFSPLTSDFLNKPAPSTSQALIRHPFGGMSYPNPYSHQQRSPSSTSLPMHPPNHPYHGVSSSLGENGEGVHRSRREWIKAWMEANPGRPAPCSAKACYRLADKLGLTELRARAFQHIVKSLTVSNVPYEVFSSFSAAFEDVRKVEVDFFLTNWSEIKSNDAMRNVFQQIRLGRHPGFEEVWPLIILNLEFTPKPISEVGGDGAKDTPMA